METLDVIGKLVSDAIAHNDLGNIAQFFAGIPNLDVMIVLSFLAVAFVLAVAVAVFWPVHHAEASKVEDRVAYYKQFYSVHRSIRLP